MVKEFWQEIGFLIKIEMPEAGVMETDWAENRAKIPQDFIRNTLRQAARPGVLDLRARQVPHAARARRRTARTEIYISHRGMDEVYTTPRDVSRDHDRPSGSRARPIPSSRPRCCAG